MKNTRTFFLSEEEQEHQKDIISQLAKEARIPIARAMMTTWSQLESPNKMRTTTGREVEISSELFRSINRLPCSGRYVFSSSPFPPTIPDKYLQPARRRFLRRHPLLAIRSL